MKASGLIAAAFTIASVSAANQALTVEYPNSCDNGQSCSDGACCNFNDNNGNNLNRCMTNGQMNGVYSGNYEDDQFAVFKWTCPEPASDSATFLKALSVGAVATTTMFLF